MHIDNFVLKEQIQILLMIYLIINTENAFRSFKENECQLGLIAWDNFRSLKKKKKKRIACQPGHNYPTFRVPDGALGGHWHPDLHQFRALPGIL